MRKTFSKFEENGHNVGKLYLRRNIGDKLTYLFDFDIMMLNSYEMALIMEFIHPDVAQMAEIGLF